MCTVLETLTMRRYNWKIPKGKVVQLFGTLLRSYSKIYWKPTRKMHAAVLRCNGKHE